MSEQQPAGAPRALRLFALVAVCVGVAALAAAAFIFSYTGIHVVALQAGVNSRLAKGYPLILDVLLVIILAAMLALRNAGWPSRLLAWVSLLALLGAAAAADALHAAGDKLPVRAAEITVAVLPWALVLIAFMLLLAMLRQAKVRRQAQASEQARPPKWQPPQPPPLSRQALVPGFPAAEEPAAQLPAAEAPAAGAPTPPVQSVEAPAADVPAAKPNDTLRLVVPRQVTPEAMADALGTEPAMAAVAPDGALDAELWPDDPSSDEAAPAPADHDVEVPAAAAVRDEPEADASEATHEDAVDTDASEAAHEDAVDTDLGEVAHEDAVDTGAADPEAGEPDPGESDGDEDIQTADMEMPVFHRMWSSPEPPSEDAS